MNFGLYDLIDCRLQTQAKWNDIGEEEKRTTTFCFSVLLSVSCLAATFNQIELLSMT